MNGNLFFIRILFLLFLGTGQATAGVQTIFEFPLINEFDLPNGHQIVRLAVLRDEDGVVRTTLVPVALGELFADRGFSRNTHSVDFFLDGALIAEGVEIEFHEDDAVNIWMSLVENILEQPLHSIGKLMAIQPFVPELSRGLRKFRDELRTIREDLERETGESIIDRSKFRFIEQLIGIRILIEISLKPEFSEFGAEGIESAARSALLQLSADANERLKSATRDIRHKLRRAGWSKVQVNDAIGRVYQAILSSVTPETESSFYLEWAERLRTEHGNRNGGPLSPFNWRYVWKIVKREPTLLFFPGMMGFAAGGLGGGLRLADVMGTSGVGTMILVAVSGALGMGLAMFSPSIFYAQRDGNRHSIQFLDRIGCAALLGK